jgi:NAD(P)H-dependent flavin oxidoreductase YrpB (nitropropane dioxygenase family)
MNQLKQPWIAFKVLAAGAIKPQEGMQFAFENGADFVCMGMYDFQIVEDCNIATDLLKSDILKYRKKGWLA